jgi:hypothetical protein
MARMNGRNARCILEREQQSNAEIDGSIAFNLTWTKRLFLKRKIKLSLSNERKSETNGQGLLNYFQREIHHQ